MSEVIYQEETIPWGEAIKQVRKELSGNLPNVWELRSYRYLAEHPLIPEQGIHGQLHVARV